MSKRLPRSARSAGEQAGQPARAGEPDRGVIGRGEERLKRPEVEAKQDESGRRAPVERGDSTHELQEEALWVVDAADGNEQAFRRLVERYQDRIYSLALRIVKDSDLAVEAAQDAFINAFKGLKRFEARSRFSTWLYRITVNVCYDRLSRNRKSMEVGLEDLAERGQELVAPHRWNAGEPLENAEGETALEEALAELNETYRLPFALRQIEGRGYGEIAEILGISEVNAKVRVHRAREMIVARLRHKGVL